MLPRMARLNFHEKASLERVLGMGSGYVLDFSNNTFAEFVQDAVGLNPYCGKYDRNGTSKANLLRTIWKDEPDHTVGKLLEHLMTHEHRLVVSGRTDYVRERVSDTDRAECWAVITRLRKAAEIDSLPSMTLGNSLESFRLVKQEVETAISENKPEIGIDRLHTFITQYLRLLIQKRSGADVPNSDKPLHSLLGEYIKLAQSAGLIKTEITIRILKASISILEALNPIRNDLSLAHPNPSIIPKDEAQLAFTSIIGLVRFLNSIEERSDADWEALWA